MPRFLLAAVFVLAALQLSQAAPKQKLPERFDRWLKQDVIYIISDEERKAFLTLTTDAQRDNFIKSFWEARNPSPGSEINAFKTEHYARIDFANATFGRMTNTPGWMTDEGRTYILFGKPESKFPFTGYGQIYPIELWFYSNKTGHPSLPSYFYVLFFQPEGIEEFRYYHPSLDGPLKLVRGSQFNSNQEVYKALLPLGGDLATAAFTLIPGDPIDRNTWKPDLSSEMLISKIQNWSNDRFNLEQLNRKRALQSLVTSTVLTVGRPLTLTTIVLADPLKQLWLDYAVAIDKEDLGVRTKSGKLALDMHYRLLTSGNDLIAEDSNQRDFDVLDEAGFHAFQIAGRLPLVPGAFRLQLELTNRSSGRTFKAESALSAPDGKQAWLAGPLLSDDVERVSSPNPLLPFQYYGAQFHPLIRSDIAAAHTLRVLYQYNSATVYGDFTATIVLANLLNRDARKVISDPLPSADFQNGSLLQAKSIPLAGLPSGEYMLALQIKDAKGVLVSSANQSLRIETAGAAAGSTGLQFMADTPRVGSSAVVDYLRGLESLATHNDAAAQTYLEQCAREAPANTFAKQFLVDIYYRQRKYAAVSSLYRSSVLSDFQTSPDLLARISICLWQTGDKERAFDVLKKAENLYPKNALLVETERSLHSR